VRVFEDSIFRKQQKIDKIAEQYHNLNIKTTILGQDANLNEYWYFKEENTRLFIKREVTEDEKDEDAAMNEGGESPDRYKWFYLESDDEFE